MLQIESVHEPLEGNPYTPARAIQVAEGADGKASVSDELVIGKLPVRPQLWYRCAWFGAAALLGRRLERTFNII